MSSSTLEEQLLLLSAQGQFSDALQLLSTRLQAPFSETLSDDMIQGVSFLLSSGFFSSRDPVTNPVEIGRRYHVETRAHLPQAANRLPIPRIALMRSLSIQTGLSMLLLHVDMTVTQQLSLCKALVVQYLEHPFDPASDTSWGFYCATTILVRYSVMLSYAKALKLEHWTGEVFQHHVVAEEIVWVKTLMGQLVEDGMGNVDGDVQEPHTLRCLLRIAKVIGPSPDPDVNPGGMEEFTKSLYENVIEEAERKNWSLLQADAQAELAMKLLEHGGESGTERALALVSDAGKIYQGIKCDGAALLCQLKVMALQRQGSEQDIQTIIEQLVGSKDVCPAMKSQACYVASDRLLMSSPEYQLPDWFVDQWMACTIAGGSICIRIHTLRNQLAHSTILPDRAKDTYQIAAAIYSELPTTDLHLVSSAIALVAARASSYLNLKNQTLEWAEKSEERLRHCSDPKDPTWPTVLDMESTTKFFIFWSSFQDDNDSIDHLLTMKVANALIDVDDDEQARRVRLAFAKLDMLQEALAEGLKTTPQGAERDRLVHAAVKVDTRAHDLLLWYPQRKALLVPTSPFAFMRSAEVNVSPRPDPSASQHWCPTWKTCFESI